MTSLVALWLSVVAAVLPTLLYVVIFYWADRYEREPGWLLTVAFFWGAIPAVAGSLVGELLLGLPFADVDSSISTELVESAVFAPVVEELAKGLALWLIYRFVRHEFDGVLDGLLYGALVGFGFAMTENIFYFIGAFADGGFGGLTAVIVLRALIFGLNHSFYTGLTGIGFGLARNAQSAFARRFWPLFGLLAAIVVHALHNFGASIASENALGLGLSLLLAFGGFCLIALTILLAWQSERKTLQRELAADVGTLLTAEEFDELVGRWRNPQRRKLDRAALNRRQLASELALRRGRLRRLGEHTEPNLTAEIETLRQQLLRSLQPQS